MKKIPIGVLGSTGSVGQKFIQLLEDHPWFEVTEIAASDKSAGNKYKDKVEWYLSTEIPKDIAELKIKECKPNLDCKVVFSGLDSSVAGKIETEFAEAGYIVISNSRNHRMDEDVPLLVPEINSGHLNLVKNKNGKGFIVTNPNCSTIGLVLALKPLMDEFGVEAVNVVTMQAVSGAGYNAFKELDIEDNVIPFIKGEEDKLEIEPQKIFGSLTGEKISYSDINISAQCNRVNVIDGHTECVQVKLKTKATSEEIKSSLINFKSIPQILDLPSAPKNPIHYFEEDHFPQPKIHRDIDKGMAVSVGRLREDSLFDFKFVILSHNTNRGAAGGAILCAELMKAKGILEKQV